MTVVLGGGALHRGQVVAVARHGEEIELSPTVLRRLDEQRGQIEALVASGRPVYGVSTGFGALANTYIAPEDRAALQRSLIRSHSAGLGDAVEAEVVRAMMLCRLRTLVSGVTGVRPSTAEAYAALLNARLTPVVHEFGSLGCSGDLAPLAHVALALIGEGAVLDSEGRPIPAREALAAAGIEPVVLAEKEGLALINGTDGMTAMAVLALADLEDLATLADLTAALSIQALRGTDRVFAEDIQALRPHPGQAASAANLRALLEGSPIVADHLDDLSQVQDAYSLRCSPQVHGAAARHHGARRLGGRPRARGSRSTTRASCPTVDSSRAATSTAHPSPTCSTSSPSPSRTSPRWRSAGRTGMLDPARSFGLPPFLAHRPGVDSGLMIAQYTQAGIVAELQRNASPASVQSIPSSAMQEDHVSMGWHAARKLRRSVDGLRRVLAVELVTAVRALQLRRPLAPSAPTAAIVEAMSARGSVPGPGPRRVRGARRPRWRSRPPGEWRQILTRHVDRLA